MSAINQNYSFLFYLFCISFSFPCITAGPISINDNPYEKFIDFLLKNNCSMPKEVELPFPQSSVSTPFSYLSIPLKECQTSEALRQNNEATLLCKEVFDVLQNITCIENNAPLPKINSLLSENICNDFGAMQDILPKRNEYLSGKLGDSVVCKVFCRDRYELLCKTLLWSYNTQSKIKNALENEVKQNEKENISSVTSKEDASNVEINAIQDETDLNNQENDKPEKKITIDIHSEDKNISLNVSNLNNSELVSNTTRNPVLVQTITKKINSSGSSNQGEENMKTTNISESIKSSVQRKVVTQPGSQTLSQYVQNHAVEPDLNLSGEDANPEENNIEKQSENVKVENTRTEFNPSTNVNSLTENSVATDNQNGANISLPILPNEKPENPITANNEMNNFNNVDFQEQENETKVKGKQTDLKSTDQDKKTEKPKEDFEISNGATFDTDQRSLEVTTLQIPSDKNEDIEQHQEDKDQEQWNDTENDGDYQKPEYDSGFNLPSKNKDSDSKSSIVSGSSQMSSNYDTYINSRNNLGRVSDDIQTIPSFPEQEDSHFFFYFLSIVFILMAGYLVFHNKQKIIALIVEGRHERRRRSHGAGYKKLETK